MPQLVPAHGGSLPEPDKENVTGRAHVAVVLGTTFRAFPMSHNKHVHPCRTQTGPTDAACLRCASFTDDFNGPAGVLALILQHPLERGPTAIEHGLGHPCPDQLLAAHVAHDNRFVPIHYPAAEFVERIRSAACRLAM